MLGTIILILINGLFSMSEIAVISARTARLRLQAADGDKGAQSALDLANEPQSFLATIQIGITLVSLALGAIGMVTTHDLALTKTADDLKDKAKNVHFDDMVKGGLLSFDYTLKEGPVTRSNALELMRSVGLNV